MKNVFLNKFSNTKLALFLAVLPIICIASCATPRPILRMKPVQIPEIAQQVFWQNGTPYIQQVEDSIGVRMGFSFFDGNQKLFLMDVEFINFSNNPILIAPEKIYYTTFDTTNNTLMNDAKLYYAIDPEKKILDLEKEIARKDASAKNNQTWAIVGATVALTATAVAIASQPTPSKNNTLQERNNNHNTQNNTNNKASAVASLGILSGKYAVDNAMLKAWEAQDLKNTKTNWERLTLRKTHLFPQESIRGSILFPSKDIWFALRYLKFVVPIEKTEKKFIFRQKWIKSELDAIQNEDF